MATKQNKMLVTLFELACGDTGATTIKEVRKNQGAHCTVKEIALVSGVEPKRVKALMKTLVEAKSVVAAPEPGQPVGGKKLVYRITVAGIAELEASGFKDKKGPVEGKGDESPDVPVEKRVTRKDRVAAMAKKGVTIEDITKEMDCTKQAAHSLLGDIKRDGAILTRERVDGVNKWTAK